MKLNWHKTPAGWRAKGEIPPYDYPLVNEAIEYDVYSVEPTWDGWIAWVNGDIIGARRLASDARKICERHAAKRHGE